MEAEFKQDVHAPPEAALAAVGEAAELWDAAWEAKPGGGRLHLPVLAGVRRGRMLAQVEVRGASGGSEIRLRVENAEYEINRPALLFLILGALGGLITILLPLYPKELIGFLPFALVMLVGAWLLVASRLRTAGPQDFLETAAGLAEIEEEREG